MDKDMILEKIFHYLLVLIYFIIFLRICPDTPYCNTHSELYIPAEGIHNEVRNKTQSGNYFHPTVVEFKTVFLEQNSGIEFLSNHSEI